MFNFTHGQRLRDAKALREIVKTGKRFSESCFTLCFVPNDANLARLGMMISKKYCALAANRNHIKRQIREQFRLHQHQFGHLDLVVMLTASTKSQSQQEQSTCIQTLFSKLTNARAPSVRG